MNEDGFLHALHECSVSPDAFHHRDHLHVTWLLIRRHDLEAARGIVADGIRALAARHGAPGKYHETMTRFWVHVIGHLIQTRPDLDEFAAFMHAFPKLLDAGLPYRHWQRQTIGGAAARSSWVAPDLLPLPW
jgi:hypothetical protein